MGQRGNYGHPARRIYTHVTIVVIHHPNIFLWFGYFKKTVRSAVITPFDHV